MALSRVLVDSGVYTDAAFPASTTLDVGFPVNPPGGMLVDDECILTVSQVASGANQNTGIVTPSHWAIWASSPVDLGIGVNGETSRFARTFYHRADGGSFDLPVVKLRNLSTSPAQVKVHWEFSVYRGGKLSWVTSGTVGNLTAAAPTLPASVASPADGFLISVAYNSATALVPAMTVANGFTLVYGVASDLPVARLGLGVAEKFPIPVGPTALPQWNVPRGLSASAHHHMWALAVIKPDVLPFIRLSGLTFGTKRRRLGQPGGSL